MLFNSLAFALFFVVVFVLYWFVFNKSIKVQNILLFVASYFFYGCWDWRFLSLLAFSTLLDFFTGLKIYKAKTIVTQRAWLIASVVINLSFLSFFKYFNFFSESLSSLLSLCGLQSSPFLLSVVLPVGISFYTFHGLSYVFDIYNKKITPTTNWINYTLFVSFFPLLVAGPIERATHLLPQIERKRKFDYSKAVSGCRQLLWGLFKKIVIADSIAPYVNQVFDNNAHYTGGVLCLAAILFAVQIYCDFSGYTDIALGTARLLGFELLKNFSFPYFSRSIAEFWRRWHISLSSWFKDYLYIPLGGSRNGLLKAVRNTFIIFVVSGFWHGANWTFIVWGALNALYIMPSILFKTNRQHLGIIAEGRLFPGLRELVQMLFTFGLVVFAWIFFRSNTVEDAFTFIGRLGTTIFTKQSLHDVIEFIYWKVGLDKIALIIFLFITEWLGRESDFAIQKVDYKTNRLFKWTFYSCIIFAVLFYIGDKDQFIYFQF